MSSQALIVILHKDIMINTWLLNELSLLVYLSLIVLMQCNQFAVAI
ncbi:hypothetical protein CZ794_04750 [Psychrobacter sp. JB385]|nr:hypothetical protein CZ794_04750 [Psychrobacter sp. JB385]